MVWYRIVMDASEGRTPLEQRLRGMSPDRMEMDARAIIDLFSRNQVIVVTGELGDGKSSLTKRVAANMLSTHRIVYLNGHIFTNGAKSQDLFERARANPMGNIQSGRELVIIDSADYLYRASKHAHGKTDHAYYMEQIMRDIYAYRMEHPNTRFLLTTHDVNWNVAYADRGAPGRQSLLSIFRSTLAQHSYEYPVPTSIPREYLHEFLQEKCALSQDDIEYFIQVSDPSAEGMQHARLAHRECQKPERAYVLQLARNPRVLKHLFAKFPSLRTALVDAREGRISARAFQCRLVHALYVADLQDVFLPLMRARAGSGVKARTKHWGDLQPLPDDVILPSME
jgi:hypothetical protein